MTEVEAVFKALASPVRREILRNLRNQSMSAGEIADLFDISAPSVSRHLAILKAARLVSDRRDGALVVYTLEPERLANTVSDFLSAVCPTQVGSRVARRGRSAAAGSPKEEA